MATLGLSGFAWSDYEVEVHAPLEALVYHLTEFPTREPRSMRSHEPSGDA